MKKISIYNLGTGKGTSVLELIKCFKYPNRPGDIAESYGDASKAEIELGWKKKYTIKEICLDSWNYVLHLHKSFQC